MSQLEDLNRAMAYIEEHLDGTVDMDVLARIAVCSKYQLQRMFPYLTGVTLPEYIRRRAMTRAAQDLRATDAKVVTWPCATATTRRRRSLGRSGACTVPRPTMLGARRLS